MRETQSKHEKYNDSNTKHAQSLTPQQVEADLPRHQVEDVPGQVEADLPRHQVEGGSIPRQVEDGPRIQVSGNRARVDENDEIEMYAAYAKQAALSREEDKSKAVVNMRGNSGVVHTNTWEV